MEATDFLSKSSISRMEKEVMLDRMVKKCRVNMQKINSCPKTGSVGRQRWKVSEGERKTKGIIKN